MNLECFFSRRGNFESYQIFSVSHIMLVAVCLALVILTLYLSRRMSRKQVLKTVRICVVLLWLLQFSKISFIYFIDKSRKLSHYLPFYFCSIPLFSGLLSSLPKGKLKRYGDVFLLVGGFAGAVGYFLLPSTTAGKYPAFHFMTIQSFFHHAVMLYIALLFIKSKYVELKIKDLPSYAITVTLMSVIAYHTNGILGSNLMFVSKSKPGTAVELVYNMSQKWFTFNITFLQAVPPFIIVYLIEKGLNMLKKSS